VASYITVTHLTCVRTQHISFRATATELTSQQHFQPEVVPTTQLTPVLSVHFKPIHYTQ